MHAKETDIPLYTKIGFRVTAVVLLIIAFFLIRDCSSAIYYGTVTPQATIRQAYELGERQGKMKALDNKPTSPYPEKNPILRKAYQKGFRAGWDAVRHKHSKTSPTALPTPAATPPPASHGG